jgi:hypothetical protein
VGVSATFPVPGADPDDLARWRRHALSAGVMGRLRHRRVFVDCIAEAVLAWLVLEKDGGGTDETLDPGLTIGLRAGIGVARRLELFASLSAWGAAWNRPGDGMMPAVAVPHWGLQVGAGASFLFGP